MNKDVVAAKFISLKILCYIHNKHDNNIQWHVQGSCFKIPARTNNLEQILD